jgi:hypothetical protein
MDYQEYNILKLIFDYLPKNDIKNNILLCKKFINVIIKLYYSKIKIDVSKIKNKDTDKFLDFINKYDLKINAVNMRGLTQLDKLMDGNSKMFLTMTFDSWFNSELRQLPAGLLELSFNKYFDQKIKCGILPESLMRLSFGAYFNRILLPNVLSLNLTELDFGDEFNQELLVDTLPPNLKYLALRKDFNQPILPNVLPSTLTHLSFGDDFDQEILPNALPSSLTYLSFGNAFNQEIPHGILPKTLKTLKLGEQFKHELVNILPFNLTCLIVSDSYNKKILVKSLFLFNQLINPIDVYIITKMIIVRNAFSSSSFEVYNKWIPSEYKEIDCMD